MTTTSPQAVAQSDPTMPGSTNKLLNGVFSFDRAIAFGSGVALIALSTVFANQFDWPTWVVVALGAVLIPYGAFLHWVIAGGRHAQAAGIATIGTDAVWVIASVIVILTLSEGATAIAPWLIGAQALIIADVGIAKVVGLKRNRR